MLFGIWTQVGPRNYVLNRVQIHTGRGTFEGDDVGIFPHAVYQYSDWLAAEAVKCHVKFSR